MACICHPDTWGPNIPNMFIGLNLSFCAVAILRSERSATPAILLIYKGQSGETVTRVLGQSSHKKLGRKRKDEIRGYLARTVGAVAFVSGTVFGNFG